MEPFVLKNSPVYPILCQAQSGAYSSGGVPHAYLVGADGKVLWSGHPGTLNDGDIEEHLKGVEKPNRVSTWAFTLQKQLPEMPASLAGVDKMLLKMQFGPALKKVETVLAGLAGDEKATVEGVRDWIAKRATEGFDKAANLARDGQPYRAFLALGEIETLYKGHDHSKRAKDLAKALESDKVSGLEIDASAKLVEIKKAMALEKDPEDQLKCLKPLLSKKYADTAAGKEAATMASDLEASVKK